MTIKKMESEELGPQSLTDCPSCNNVLQVTTFVVTVGKEEQPHHVEFCYKCLRCGFSRSSPEQYL